MMRLPETRALPITLPVAALADVALLFVLFFVLTTTYDVDRTPVTLPVSATRAEAEFGSACVTVRRDVTPTGRELLTYRFADGRGGSVELSGPEGVYLEASRIADRDPGRTFVVRADASVRYAIVDGLLEVLRSAGVRRVVLWAREREGSDGGARP